MDRRQVPGLALIVGGAQFLIALFLAESLYPDYSVSANFVSDLGVMGMASAPVFNTSVIILGLLGIVAAVLFWRNLSWKALAVTLMLSSIGSVGVGIFPETTGPPHVLAALLAFGFGAISAILSARVTRPPFSYIAAILGGTALIFLIALVLPVSAGYPPGALERLILYPILIWEIGFGGYLLRSP
jgi:hypothetical membrane protein